MAYPISYLVSNNRKPLRTLLLTVLSLATFAAAPAPLLAANDEPIAGIGHGTMVDRDGKTIFPTADFVAKAQAFYRDKLLSGLSAAKKREFAEFEKQLNTGIRAEGQARLMVQQHALEWLMANAKLNDGGRTEGKIRYLRRQLNTVLPARADTVPDRPREEFKLDPALEQKLKLPQFNQGGFKVLSFTTNSGQAYINECAAAGVPIPPSIGQLDAAGLAGWKTQGFIPIAKQFIGQDEGPSPAEIRTFHVPAPSPQEGMCIALPRYKAFTNKATVRLDGVICLSKLTSKVCFWDNQIQGVGFPFPAGTVIPIGVPSVPGGLYQAGGFELEGGDGGVCTDCHAGQNPYIVHPRAELEDANGVAIGLKMGELADPPLNLPMFSNNRYDPLVAESWPQNQLSHSPALVPDVCVGCHQNGGIGGAFPHLSTDLNGSYCGTVLGQAITRTMPPGAEGTEAGNSDVTNFRNMWCGMAPDAGPANRGDPHLTTTNGINYDFQSAGEFTALRNSATGFELQTRQTPVSTTFMPGPNAHTGLASCVSLNTAVALRVGKRRVTYQPIPGRPLSADKLQLRIDGALVNLPAKGLNLGNGNRIARASVDGGIDVSTVDGTRVIVSPNFWTSQGYWYLNVEVLNTPAREGTMGPIFDGHWLPLAPNGSSFGPAPASIPDRHALLNQKFADAWRVKTTNSLFDYAAGTSTADFTDRNWPPEPGKACKATLNPKAPVKPLNRETAQRLCRAIKDKVAFENCVFDVVVMGDTDVLKAYVQSLKLRAAAGN